MTTTSAVPVRRRGALWRAVGDHPVAAMLIMMFTANFALLIPAALAGVAIEPFLLGAVLLGQLLPAVLVSAASGGRPAVRALFGRVFRWRVNPTWYLVALFGLPAASLLVVAAMFGPGSLQVLTTPTVVTGYLSTLSIFPLVNLWEETAWMGIVQSGLSARRGPLVAAAITGPLFGLQHLALHIGQPAGKFVLGMLFLMAAAIPFRLMIGWMYNVTGGSVLLVALTHATFNATNNSLLLPALAPGHASLVSTATWIVVGVAALLIGVLTRGRFGTGAR